jgi:transmembrane sensor
MTAGDNGTDLNAVDLEALRWVLLMESGPLSPEEQRRLDAWVAESSRHKGALIRAQAASLRLDRLGAFAGGRSVLGPLPSSPADRPRAKPRWPIPRWIGTAAAAGLVAGIVGLGAWLSRERMQEPPGGIQYISNRGELKEVKLADGSAMTLNTQTEVRVQYTRERRDIHLIQGEALFTVAHDPRRPFTVAAGEWTAVAVGTAFSVHRLDAATTNITVTEGVVEMRRADRSGSDGWPRLTRNQEAILDADSTVKVLQVSASDIGKQLAWRNHLVVFTGESLSQALVEMNRYSPRRIAVEDPELAGRQIVGVFSTLDTQAFVSGMEATLNVQAVESDHTILLHQTH